eukprot:scaffold3.g6286.t1
MGARRGRPRGGENDETADGTPQRRAVPSPSKAPASVSRLRPLDLPADAGFASPFSPASQGSTPVLFTAHKGTAWMARESQDGAPAAPAAPAATPDGREESIKVIVRVRPLNDMEQQPLRSLAAAEGGGVGVQKTSAQTLMVLTSESAHHTFDHVAGASSSQEHLFKIVGRPMAEHALAGFNSTVLAYGQTGSGKTYTMLGELPQDGEAPFPAQAGLIPRLFAHLFRRIAEVEGGQRPGREVKFRLACSLLEVYQEVVTDLLNPAATKLAVREGDRKRVHVEGLSEHAVVSVGDVLALLARGAQHRHTAATRINSESSRSHMVFTCCIESRTMDEAGVTVRTSQLNLVDLAGSERQKVADTEGARLKEAASINTSLFSLGQVINKLVEGQGAGHVPYRNSKLTFLLQARLESLGGNARTVLIAAVSPAACCLSETQNSLAFARRAKSVVNRAVVNEQSCLSAHELQEEVVRLRRELAMLRGLREGGGGAGGSNTELAEALRCNQALEEKVERLQEQLQALRRERDSLDTELGQQAVAASEVGVAAEAAAEEAQAACQMLEVQLADRAAFLEAMQGELRDLRAERDAGLVALAEKSRQLAEQEAATQRLEGEGAVLRAQLQAAAEAGAPRGGEGERDGIAAQISALEATAAALNQRHAQLLQRTEEIAEERDALKQRVQGLESRAGKADRTMATSKEELAFLRTTAQRMSEGTAAPEVEKQVLAKRVEELGQELENAQQAHESLRQQLERRERRHQERLHKMKEHALVMEARAAYAEKHRQMAEREQAGTEAELLALRTSLPEELASRGSQQDAAQQTEGDRQDAAQQTDPGSQDPVEAARAQAAASAERPMKVTVAALRTEAATAAGEMLQLQTTLAEVTARLAAEDERSAEREAQDQEARDMLLQQLAERDQRVQEIRDQVDQSNAQCSELAQRLQAEHGRVTELASTCDALEEMQALREEQLQALQAELEVKGVRIEELSAQLEESEVDRRALEEQLGVGAAEAATLRASNSGLSARAAELEGEVEARSAAAVQLQADLAVVREEAANSAAELAARTDEVAGLHSRLDALSLELEAARQEAADCAARLAAKDSEVASLGAAAAGLASQLDALSTDLEVARAQATDAADRLATRDAELDGLREEAAGLVAHVSVLASDLVAARQLAEEREAATTVAMQRGEELDGIILDLENQLSAAENALAASTGRLAALETELSTARQAADQAEQEGQALQWRIADLTARSEDMQAALLVAMGEAEAAAACSLDLNSRAEDLESQLQAAHAQAAERVAALEQRLAAESLQATTDAATAAEAARAQRDALQAQLDEALAACGAAEARAGAVEQQEAAVEAAAAAAAVAAVVRQAALQIDLDTAQCEAASAGAELASCQGILASLEAQLAETQQAAARAAGESRSKLQELQEQLAAVVRDNLASMRGAQAELQELKGAAEATQRETRQLQEALHQAVAEATEKAAVLLEERQAHEETVAALKQQVSKLKSSEKAKGQQLLAALARSDELRQQLTGLKQLRASQENQLSSADAEVEALRSELERARCDKAERDREVRQLAERIAAQDNALGQQQAEAGAVAVQRKRATVLQRELGEARGRLVEVQAALALAEERASAVSAASPRQPAPSVDVGRLLRDQKDALQAQHEATVVDLKAELQRQLDSFQRKQARERDSGVAELARAAEAQRAVAAAAAAEAARHKAERDKVMDSLVELQHAFQAHMQGHKDTVEGLKQGIAARDAELAQLRAASRAPHERRQVQLPAPPRLEDLEDDAVIVAQSLAGGSLPDEPTALRPRSPNVRGPAGPGKAGGGWRPGYERAFQSQDAPLGLLHGLVKNRHLVQQGENGVSIQSYSRFAGKE